jgi:hypothetical protein
MYDGGLRLGKRHDDGTLYSWSMAVYCVGEVGMVRHDSWITLRAFEESLFSITALSASKISKMEEHTTRDVDFTSTLRDHLNIDPRFRQSRKHHTSTSDSMAHILSDQ